MNKRIVILMVITVMCFLFVGCYSINVPVVMSEINPPGSKVGEASGTAWFGTFGKIDDSVETAMRNGNITKVSTVEFTAMYAFFQIYQHFTVVVTGE